MKVLTEVVQSIQTKNGQTGNPFVVNGVAKALITTISGKQVWCAAGVIGDKAEVVTYKLHEKGDTFVADRDSTRNFPKGHANGGNPLYLEGETVTRIADFVEFVACSEQKVQKFASEQDKLQFLVAAGAKFSV